jgi:hypothetical protein
MYGLLCNASGQSTEAGVRQAIGHTDLVITDLVKSLLEARKGSDAVRVKRLSADITRALKLAQLTTGWGNDMDAATPARRHPTPHYHTGETPNQQGKRDPERCPSGERAGPEG